MKRKAHQSVSGFHKFLSLLRPTRTTAGATIARGVFDVGNLGAVNTSASRGASAARVQFRERLEALVLAQHAGNGALFETSRAEVEYYGLARP